VSTGQLALRGTIGPLFAGHGAQKLFGAFGGHGIEGTGGFFESLGLRPGKRHATAAGVAEFAGGVLLTAGALTPLATAALTGTMVTAIRKVHASNGPWVTESGWEYNAVLIAAVTALADMGPGRLSVDGKDTSLKGPLVALASLGAGVAGSFLATEVFSDSASGPQEGSAASTADPASPGGAAEHGDDGRFAHEPAQTPAQTQV
jgi:putative oxidoreductase